MSRRDKIEQLLLKEPEDVFLNFSFAMELAREGESEAALERFDRVIALDPNYSAAFYHKGNTLISFGRTQEARETLSAGCEAAQRAGDEHAHREMAELLASIA